MHLNLFHILALVLTLTAFFSYLNHRFLRFPPTIGVMVIALSMSVGLNVAHELGYPLDEPARHWLGQLEFDQAVLKGMLAFLLFAGALHVDLTDLMRERLPVTVLATGGVLLSTLLIGVLMWLGLELVGLGIPIVYAFLFGALISPTDPVAVLGILKVTRVSKDLETQIAGESLFNDGIGVVVFLAVLGFIAAGGEWSPGAIASLLLRETVVGAALGFVFGMVGFALLRSVNDYRVEVLGSLSLAMGTYAAADVLHSSGPIAVVVAGLLIGNHGRRLAMSENTREHLDTFWELVDEILNAVLFVLIGLECLIIPFDFSHVCAGVLAIVIVLFGRFASVGVLVQLVRRMRELPPFTARILTWAGLRGGISVALALSLPHGPERDTIVSITYFVVVFSIIVQGLTLGPLLRRSGMIADVRSNRSAHA